MKREINIFKLFLNLKAFWKFIEQQISLIPLFFLSNIITIIALSILSLYAKVERKGTGIESLFSDPFDSGIPYLGWLTSISEIMWCAVISICVFTLIIISRNNKSSQITWQESSSQKFLLVSILLMSLLYIDDRFRITLILCYLAKANIKIIIYLGYGSLLILYAKHWWYKIKMTPYLPLLICFCLFAFSSFIDVAPLHGRGVHAMLEDGPKLIGLINLTIYFCSICVAEIQKYYQKLV
jgi:hypothetical protein